MAALIGAGLIGGAASPAAATVVIASSTTPFTDISITGTLLTGLADDSEHTLTGAMLTTAGFNGNQLLAGGVAIRIGNNGGVIWGNSATDAFTNATDVGAINSTTFMTMVGGNSSFGTPTGNGGLGPRQFLAVFWDDNFPAPTNLAAVRWQVISGNLIVQWTNESHFSAQTGGGSITYQMVVYGGRTIASGQPLVEFIYNDTFFAANRYQNDGGSATIGYKNWGINPNANDVEFGVGGGNNTLTDPAFGDATMHPKIAGWAEAATASLPHAVAVKGPGAACPADFDNNGQIQPADVAAFVGAWFTSIQDGTLVGDFDNNGAVQPADVAAFVAAWFNALSTGSCP